MNLDACHDIISFAGLWEILKGENQILARSLQMSLRSGYAPAWGKGGRCPPDEMQHKQAADCSSPSLATGLVCDPEVI